MDHQTIINRINDVRHYLDKGDGAGVWLCMEYLYADIKEAASGIDRPDKPIILNRIEAANAMRQTSDDNALSHFEDVVQYIYPHKLDPFPLILERMYRVTKTADEPKLRGRSVVFKGYVKHPHDIRRATIRIVNDDGSLGDEWLVNSTILQNL